MKRKSAVILLLATLALPLAAVKVSFSGYLDADLATDFKGGHTAAHELDLGMNLDFGRGVGVGLFATSISGRVPAAGDDPANRWSNLAFDGLTVTLSDKLGKGSTVELIDLVYQFGSADAYYFYKRLSIITPESFLRGASFGMSTGSISYKVMAGVDKANDAGIAGNVKISGLNIMASYKQSAFTNSTDGNVGALAFGATLEGLPAGIKLTAGFISPVIDGIPEFGEAALNLSASFTVSLGGNLSLAGYILYTDDNYSMNANYLGTAFEEFLAYIEPGIKLSDYVSVGLPIEFHKFHRDSNEQIWIVPTIYFYPVKGVEIWAWGQAVLYTGSGDPDYFGGLEAIVKF